jgi:hypothetical protein
MSVHFANYWAQQKRELEAAAARPFRFEDLNGEPEPGKWGPVYPKTASAAVEKWRMVARGRELTADESAAYGAAVHAWINALNNPRMRRAAIPESDLRYKFSSAKHCAALRAAFHAGAAADRRRWALGLSKDANGDTIAQAYAKRLAAKRNRESAIAAAETVRIGGLEALGRPMAEAA